MKKNAKRYLACLLAVLVLAAMTGCNEIADEGDDVTVDYPVTLYYVNSEYLDTGDDSVEPMIAKDAVLTIEQEDAEDRYEETLELMADGSEGASTMIRYGMIDEVTVKDGLAIVDFNEEEMNGGSTEELYLIEQVVRTLIKSFDEIEKVRFTVDEREVETLMGHMAANCTYGLLPVEEDGVSVELVSILD